MSRSWAFPYLLYVCLLHVVDSYVLLKTFIAMKTDNCHILCAIFFELVMTIFYLQLYNSFLIFYLLGFYFIYWWASQNRRCSRAQDFFQKCYFWTIFGFWSLPKQRRGGTPPPPFHIKNFKIFTKSKTWPFLELETRPGRIFDGIYDVFCTCLNFDIKTCNFKNYQKITKKSISSWCLAVFGFRPLPQTSSSPGPFLTVFAMFYAHRALFKKEPFLCLRGRVGGTRRLPL